jgi:hypothetical protein
MEKRGSWKTLDKKQERCTYGKGILYPATNTERPKETLLTLYCKLVETLPIEPLTKTSHSDHKKPGDLSFVLRSRNQRKTMLKTTKTEGNAYFLHLLD